MAEIFYLQGLFPFSFYAVVETVDVNIRELKDKLKSVLNEEFEIDSYEEQTNNTVYTMTETAIKENTV